MLKLMIGMEKPLTLKNPPRHLHETGEGHEVVRDEER
jgi:hypothetical protein